MAIKKKTLIEKIKDQALFENAELKGHNLRGHYLAEPNKKCQTGTEFIEKNDFQPFFHKHVLSLSEKPVSLDSFVNFDPDVFTTAGWYSIKYVPIGDKWRIPNRPYLIGQDAVRIRVQVSGPKHWHCLCKRIPELGWIERNSTLTDYMFGIAKAHQGMSFYFSVDWVKYDKMIRAKAKAENIDIDNKPFVTYMATEEKLANLNSTYFLAPQKTKQDYIKELEKFDKNAEEEVDIAHPDML